MKRADITTGTLYTNSKGRFRLVTGEGDAFRLYGAQEDGDCIEYLYATTSKRGLTLKTHDGWGSPPRRTRHHFHITRSSFASWAKRVATAQERALFDAAAAHLHLSADAGEES